MILQDHELHQPLEDAALEDAEDAALELHQPLEDKYEALVVSEPNVLEVGLCDYGVCLRLIR